MKELKKSPRQQLEKFSTIFMQLGLVLVLFVVFISLEHETEQTAVVIEKPYNFPDTPYTMTPVDFVIEKPVPKLDPLPKQEQRVVTIIENPEVVDNKPDTVETVIDTKQVEKPLIDANKIIEEEIPEDINLKDDPEPISIDFVTKIPIFKGCEDLDEIKGRKCFNKKMNKLVKRHFNAGLVNELGLKQGKNKILTQFVIDRTGNVVDVKIRASHARLEKETQRVINKIPSFTPGEKNGEPANVRYMLPIRF